MKNKLLVFHQVLILIIISAVTGCIGTPSLRSIVGDSWQEEALQYDGSIIIIKRSNSYKGFREIGQSIPVGEHKVSFTIPKTGKNFTWISEYSKKFGRADFNLLAIHTLDGVPYVVVQPNLCLAYNYWGRPNPPYLFFKNVDNTWKRIELADLPKQFTTINVLINPRDEVIHSENPISAKTIKLKNVNQSHPEYQHIFREPVTKGMGLFNCPDWNAEQYRSPKAPFNSSSPQSLP